ncbi:DUF7528 family protein [Halorussus halobius]|uniref:DUF7528 family protein n=1 Tax=Halorussus halobius TaxID=1710537 RepID=UPI001FCECC3E|nr:hypothetical protein [Halorussus halobius]
MRRDGESIVLAVDGRDHELTSDEAADLQDAVGEALTQRREFFRTEGVHRADGSYEVARRGADSAGNSKVFEGFGALRRLFDRLPAAFGAEDVGRAGITGSRRHMLVRHFAEHPAFDCGIASRNPLTAEKTGDHGSVEEAVASDEPTAAEDAEVVSAD